MTDKPKIIVIGAANIDLIGFSKDKLIYKDSNIGTLETFLGGVGRNIAENLKHLDFDVEFLSVLADDEFSKMIIDSCNDLDISIKHSLIRENRKTSFFMAIMNRFNDMALGLSAMDIYDDIPDSFILDNLEIIAQNDYCVLETNLPTHLKNKMTKKLFLKVFYLIPYTSCLIYKNRTFGNGVIKAQSNDFNFDNVKAIYILYKAGNLKCRDIK